MLSQIGIVVCGSAMAQTPFVNLIWEANDGRGWTRQHLVTAQTAVQVRLLAEWGGGSTGVCFGGVSYDAIITNAALGDSVTNLTRLNPFAFIGQTLGLQRFGTVIKLDDSIDQAAPGQGGGWIKSSQVTTQFGDPVDTSNPAYLFGYTLTLDSVARTRRASMIVKTNPSGGEGNAVIYTAGSAFYVVAPIEAIDIEYVPAPAGFAVVLTGLGVFSRRVRRSAAETGCD